jgi:transposase
VQQLKAEYIENISDIPKDKIYYIDEMGVGMNLIPNYGYAPSNERVYDKKPTAKGKRISLIGAMNNKGIQATMCIEGTTNTIAFLYFIENIFSPILKKGDYVVIDNASIHKNKKIRQLIEKSGAKLIFLPPYHPDLNPIELAWNKIKHFLKKQRARTVETLYTAYEDAIEQITEENAQSFFTKSDEFLI